jgi:hypothetical protein
MGTLIACLEPQPMIGTRDDHIPRVEPEGQGASAAFPFRFDFHRRERRVLHLDVELFGGVTRTKRPSGSRRRMVEKSRTMAGRPIGLPSWNQVPSRAIRIALFPQCSGFHFSTGGSFFSSASRAISASERWDRSVGASGIGIAYS